MHIVKLIGRRFPKHKESVIAVLMLISLSFLLLGLGLMFIK
jgi:hypothetical protein